MIPSRDRDQRREVDAMKNLLVVGGVSTRAETKKPSEEGDSEIGKERNRKSKLSMLQGKANQRINSRSIIVSSRADNNVEEDKITAEAGRAR